MTSTVNQQPGKVMTQDQFTQVVEAILDGKYSWACVLILRFAGYNPLHYIPYRTYNRLTKDNRFSSRKLDGQPNRAREDRSLHNCLMHLEDLGHLEILQDSQAKIQGGTRYMSISAQISTRLWLTDLNFN